MLLGLVLAAAQFAAAFLVLDLFFRWMDVSAEGFAARVRGYSRRYALVAAVCCAGTALWQWRLADWPGAVLVAADAVPWWLLWRFGLRKQLTFLFKADGGRPLDRKNPDL
jgi:hypothetical protein